MNIKEYYSKMTHLYLCQTVVTALVLVMIVLPHIKKIDQILIPFTGLFLCVYMSYFFSRYLYFSYRLRILSSIHSKQAAHGYYNKFLVVYTSQIDSLIDVYFTNGLRYLSIYEMKGKDKDQLLMTHFKRKKGQLFKIKDYSNHFTSYLLINKNELRFLCNNQVSSYILNNHVFWEDNDSESPDFFEIKKLYSDINLLKNGQSVMMVKKGVMPVKWQLYFNPNTPIVTFNHQLENEEKHFYLSLFALF